LFPLLATSCAFFLDGLPESHVLVYVSTDAHWRRLFSSVSERRKQFLLARGGTCKGLHFQNLPITERGWMT
jgi:hypothetical protein